MSKDHFRKGLFLFLFFLFVRTIPACNSGTTSTPPPVTSGPPGIGSSDGGFTLTLWVETNSIPNTTYYDNLAKVLTDNPSFSFGKVLIRVNGDGAASGEPWYDSMNPAGNGGNPIILEILKQLQGTNFDVYYIPYLSKIVKTDDDERWDIYTGLADDAPSLTDWWANYNGTGDPIADDYFHGSLKQAIKWAVDMNAAATANGITKQFTGIIFEPEGSPYPNDERTPQAIKYYQGLYGTNLKVGMTGDPGQGSAYQNYAKDGVLDEGYLQMYNLTTTVNGSSTIYMDAKSADALSGKTTAPVFPNSIYTDAWLNKNSVAPSSAVWNTANNWSTGQDMGFEYNPSNSMGLLTEAFYNNGSGYESFVCTTGACPKIYLMFSTECGDGVSGDVPNGITCDCVVDGCPQSQINAFGTWSTADGADQFKSFLSLANAQWQMPTDQFAIFQYQLIPKSWLGLSN